MRSDSWGHEFWPLFGGRRCLFVGGRECMECMLLSAGGMEFVHWWEVVCSSECPLSEVPLYNTLFTLLTHWLSLLCAGSELITYDRARRKHLPHLWSVQSHYYSHT